MAWHFTAFSFDSGGTKISSTCWLFRNSSMAFLVIFSGRVNSCLIKLSNLFIFSGSILAVFEDGSFMKDKTVLAHGIFDSRYFGEVLIFISSSRNSSIEQIVFLAVLALGAT